MSRLLPTRPAGISIGKARVDLTYTALVVVVLGDLLKTGLGTICSFGIGWLTVTCPLGFLQLALAARDPLVQLWPSVALGALTIVIAGRYFCAWVCPTVLVMARFGRAAERVTSSLAKLHPVVALASKAGPGRKNTSATRLAAAGNRDRSLTRYGVLGGALLSSLVFGFPVFCAVCPVGLFFGSLFAAKRLFLGQEPGWELLVFPAVILIEVLFAKSWCRSLCPLGALLGLFASFNRFLRPSVDGERCLRSRGTNCTACERACPEGIALASTPGVAAPRECTKCLSCYENCPAKAIDL